MISLRLFVLILVTLVCRETTTPVPTREFYEAIIAAAGISLGFGLGFKALILASLLKWQIPPAADMQGIATATNGIEEYHDRIRSGVSWVWIAILPVTFLTTGLGHWIATIPDQSGMQLIALTCWFAPSILVLLMMELTSAQFEHIIAEQAAINTRAVRDWPSNLLKHILHGDLPSLLICLLPVAATTCFIDLLTLAGMQPLGPVGSSAISAMTLGAFLMLLPWFLGRRVSASASHGDPVSQRCTNYLSKTGLSGVSVRIVSGQWHGAAIVGFIPGFRQLWISRSIIERLSEQEIDVVIMHEISHLKRYHFLVRFAPILAAAAALVAVYESHEMIAAIGLSSETALTASKILGVSFATVCLLAGVSLAAWKCELDADRHACKLATLHCSWAATNSPAAVLASALIRLIGESPKDAAASWLHPSLKRRLENLDLTDPTVESIQGLGSI